MGLILEYPASESALVHTGYMSKPKTVNLTLTLNLSKPNPNPNPSTI